MVPEQAVSVNGLESAVSGATVKFKVKSSILQLAVFADGDPVPLCAYNLKVTAPLFEEETAESVGLYKAHEPPLDKLPVEMLEA